MFSNHRPVWEEVNLDNLAYNMKNIRARVKSKELFAVVKADAYGHGAVEAAPVLLENGATRLAIAVLSEGVELRRAGLDCPIMILGYTPETLFAEILEYDLEPTLFSFEYAEKLSRAAAAAGKTVKIHIKVDTGMGRIGFLPNEESVREAVMISKLPNLEIEGLFSHFSTADELNKEYSNYQYKNYTWFMDRLLENGVEINIRDIDNSAAIMDLPETNLDGARPGIIMYGYYPSDEVDKSVLDIKPVMSLKACLLHIKTLEEGQYIGYGRKFKTERKSVIGTIGIGYADGYTRMLSKKAKVIINGKFAPVVGNICMDQCMIDLTDAGEVKVGDEVILMGTDGKLKFDADDIAPLLGTINYEVLCMIGRRVPRVYTRGGEVVKVKDRLLE